MDRLIQPPFAVGDRLILRHQAWDGGWIHGWVIATSQHTFHFHVIEVSAHPQMAEYGWHPHAPGNYTSISVTQPWSFTAEREEVVEWVYAQE